jgi:hypothetical protein
MSAPTQLQHYKLGVSVCDIIQNFQVKELLFIATTLQSFIQIEYDGF